MGISVAEEGKQMPAQGTIRLSPDAYKRLAHAAIGSEVRVNVLLDAVISTRIEKNSLPDLAERIKEHRKIVREDLR